MLNTLKQGSTIDTKFIYNDKISPTNLKPVEKSPEAFVKFPVIPPNVLNK